MSFDILAGPISIPGVANILITIFGIGITATFVNQAKRAWEKHHDTKYSIRMLSGALRNISRHYIATAHKMNYKTGKAINRTTLEKAIINNDFISETIKSNISTIGSKSVTFELHRFVLTMRNTNIDYTRTLSKNNSLESIELTDDNINDFDVLIERTYYISQVASEFGEALSNFGNRSSAIANIFGEFVFWETKFVSDVNNKFKYDRRATDKDYIESLRREFLGDEMA